MPAFIQKIHLQNVLSFGPDNPPLELRPLNVLIGPNGSGKSNLIECLNVMRASSDNLSRAIEVVSDFLWKGATRGEAELAAIFHPGHELDLPLKHVLVLSEKKGRLELVNESIENAEKINVTDQDVNFYYRYQRGHPIINPRPSLNAIANVLQSAIKREDLAPDQSILAQRKEPHFYPELAYLHTQYSLIRIYREWNFNRHISPRKGQRTDLPRTYLEEDASNLALVLDHLEDFAEVRPRILDLLQKFDEGITDYKTKLSGTNEIQLYLFYNGLNKPIPATRLSDGTLRFLCLLAILCHPEIPSVVCIEEPETGLHPDSILLIAELLKEASTRCQLFVTTHSEMLVDTLSDTPESVLICEKKDGQTSLQRLDPDQLSVWLEKYRLGRLWAMGELG